MIPFKLWANIGRHDATQFSDEQARNVINTVSSGTKDTCIQAFPGLKLVSYGAGVDRGDTVMSGVRYVINGKQLFRESESGTRTACGPVDGTGRAIFANDGANLYFVTDGIIYKFDGVSVSTVSQSVVSNPSSIAYINRKFIISGASGLFSTSDVADGDTYDSLNYAEAETQPDPLLRIYTFSQINYMMGSETIELWRDTGSGNPPVSRQDTALVNVGIAGRYAVANTDQYMYWLGDDRKVYKCIASSFQSITSSGVSNIISGMDTVSDCIASTLVYDGQDFAIFKFPSEGITLVYSETLDYWVELSSGTDKSHVNQWLGNAVTQCYGKNLVTDFGNGNTYELDDTVYTDNGEAKLYLITSKNFSARDIKSFGRIITSGAFFNMQVGVGLAEGQGSAPVMMCEFSHEGGEVWQSQQFVDVGAMGDYTKRVQFDQFANGYQIKLRLMWSDPVKIVIWGGEIDLQPGGY